MKIILKENIERLGKKGEIVNVKNGYARNYLFPKGKAIQATTNNIKSYQNAEKLTILKENKALKVAKQFANKLKEIAITAAVQAGEDDRLFGSVTSIEITNLLKAEGFDIEKKMVVLDEPLKALGVYKIPIKIHREVIVEIKLWIVKAE